MASTSLTITTTGTGPNAYPGLVFDANESGAVYREDREVAGVMYRAINATFDGTNWSLFNVHQRAYAIVQNSDNSIGHLIDPGTNPWTTNQWLGSSNVGVFYAADYGMSTTDTTGTSNTAALQAAVNAAAANGGGVIYIAAGIYLVNGTVSIPPVWPLSMTGKAIGFVITGADEGTELAQQSSTSSTFSSVPFMMLDNNEKGILFQRLRFSFAAVDVSQATIPYAVYSQVADVICQECFFADGPAMYMGGLHNGLSYCTVDYDVQTHTRTNNAQLVVITGSQDFVDHTEIRQNSQHGASPGPTGCVGVVIQTVSTCFITNVHIDDLDTGIWVQGGGVNNLLHTYISNVSCQCWSYAVRVQPNISGGFIFQVFFDSCAFGRSQYSPGEDSLGNPLPGVLVALFAGDTDNTLVSDIQFASCISHDWAGAGLEVRGGQDIVVTGGRFAANATDVHATTSGGISVTGPAVRVLITGADCSGKMPDYNARPAGSHLQPYGISVSAAVSSMRLRGCILGNNGTGPLFVATGISPDIQVADCSGYSDQGTVVTTSFPMLGHAYTVAQLGAYYGPGECYVDTAGANVKINGQTTHLTSGSFYLQPGETIEVDTSLGHFVVIGK